jgi:hypothetical protein
MASSVAWRTDAGPQPTEFFALWNEADADVPALVQAKAEYAKLKGVYRLRSGSDAHRALVVRASVDDVTAGVGDAHERIVRRCSLFVAEV